MTYNAQPLNDKSLNFVKETFPKLLPLHEFATQVDFTPVFDAIEKKLGFAVEFPTLQIIEDVPDGFRIKACSENIVDKCGAFSAVMDQVYLADFGSGVCVRQYTADGVEITRYNNNTDAEVAETKMHLWLRINFRYSFKNGGSNGNEFLYASVKENEGWEIEFVGSN